MRTARRLVTQELLRAVEDALCLLDGGLNLFDLPICRLAQPPRRGIRMNGYEVGAGS
jgi:hypothetical protein